MRLLSIISLLTTASVYVLAQETATATTTSTQTGSASSCDAQNILDACVDSIQVQLDACGANEWDCLCEQTNNMLTCYNNCPGDGGRNGIQQQRTSYCNAAGQLSSTSTASHTATSTRTSTSSEETGATATGDGTAASETAEDAAARLELGLGAGVGVGLVVLGGFV